MKIKLSNAGPVVTTELEPMPRDMAVARAGQEPYDVLMAGQRALSASGATYWLTYGSLLGWVRDGEFMGHDTDIDMAVLADVDADAVTTNMLLEGLRLVQFSTTPRGTVQQKFIAPHGTVLDLLYIFEDAGELLDEYKAIGKSLANGRHLRTPVAHRRFAGFANDVAVPQDSEAYLAVLYGDTWRTPIRFWDWFFAPPNVVLHLRPGDVGWFMWRCLLHIYFRGRHTFRSVFAKSRP